MAGQYYLKIKCPHHYAGRKYNNETYPIYFKGVNHGEGRIEEERITAIQFSDAIKPLTKVRDDETTIVYK